ncbi:MAG TPA: hypothetical protein VMO26_29910 [Vicinamibacterales bacterium]|nr:hypothetical protein [Vicinamibacterales bacterium]
MSPPESRGFALIEALIASLLIAIAVVGFAHLVAVASAQAVMTRQSATALMLAQAKLEELRGLAWRFDADGSRVSRAELATSPPSTLVEDLDGYVERLDRFGSSAPPDDEPHYRRRWAIAPLSALDPDTLVLQVCVYSTGRAGGAPEACVWALRTRKP